MKFEKMFEAIDTHTCGNPTRTLIKGVPKLEGNTMAEKMQYFEKHYDWIRTATQCEPRGSEIMSGTVLMEPCDPDADIGVFYIDASGYMPMCGHSTIGITTAVIETGIIEAKEPYTTVKIDTPAGLVTAKAEVKDNSVVSVTFRNIPGFLYKTAVLNFKEFGEVEVDIAYGGNSYVIVSADKFGLEIAANNATNIFKYSKIVLDKANEDIGFVHPEKPFINKITHVQWYADPVVLPDANFKNTVVFLPGSIDRSPCGTGTSARVCSLYAKGKLKLNEKFVHESIIGGRFTARVIASAEVGGYKGGIPEVTGSAYISGFHKFVLDPNDPFKKGFFFG